ncbi:transposase [Meiothermus sp.]|uniref:transposase n=1 Tax=Meiothermus sp. TaxID=1955249 RepID=UPI00261D26FA|nr:transposase [Meiothermus sp.]
MERLRLAPRGMYLGVDLVPVEHQGCWIEGVDRVYSSSDKAPVWGHNLLSSGLVRLGEPPYPLSLEGFPSAALASEPYAYRTPGQALLQTVKVVTEAGYDLKGVVFDNQFAGQVHLAGLCAQNVPFVARARLNQKVGVELEGEARHLSIRELGEQYPPSKARYYKLIVLFSTLPTGVQEVIAAWKARWDLERVHRLLKQNLGLCKCLCRSYAAQLKHADLTLTALLCIREQKQLSPALSWRKAQLLSAQSLRRQLLTGLSA